MTGGRSVSATGGRTAMRLLFPYLRRYRSQMGLALLFAAANQILQLLDPLIARTLVDRFVMRYQEYAPPAFMRGVASLALAMVGVAILARLAKTFQDYLVAVVTQRLGADLYADGIRHSLALPYAVFEDQRSGETLGKLQKVRTDVEKLVATAVGTLFTALVAIVFITVYAFTVHWVIAPAYFIALPLLGTMSSGLSRQIKRIQRVIMAETTALAGSTTESLRNVELVKSMGLASQEIERLNSTNEKIVRLELRKVRSLRVLAFVKASLIVALRAGITVLMVYLIYRQELTIGQWMSFWLYSFFIFGPLQDLGTVQNTFRETEASLDAFRDILAMPPEARPLRPVSMGPIDTVVFEGVGFTHHSSQTPALADVSFAVRRGETVAFVGPSGAGKTTLVKLLVGLYSPPRGRILYNGVPGHAVDLDELRAQVGIVTQDTQLFAGSIGDNLRFGRSGATDEECLAALSQASCTGLLARADRGLGTPIGEGGIKVSGGERQRLAIARALLRRPRLLVFDEATSSLDSLTEHGITLTMQEVASPEVITIMIAHRLSTVLHADTIYVLERGRIVEKGRHSELVEKKGLYYAMWRQQIGERSGLDDERVEPVGAGRAT